MAFPAGWTRRAPIVIDAVDDDITDFTVHLDADCFPSEALDSGSGNKALPDGADLRFSSDISGSTELPFEVVRWVQDASAPNRKATVHVKVPALSRSATTTIYVWYGNGSASMPAAGDTNGRNAVWADYAHVLHLDSVSAATNSTGASAWTFEGSPAATYEGPAGLMLDLDGTDDAVQGVQYNPNDHCAELLVRCDATSDQIVLGRSLTGGAAHVSESLWVSGSKPSLFVDTDGALTYGYTLADTVNASTSAVELWQVRNRSSAGGQVVSKALPASEATHQAWASDGTYLYSIGGHQLNTAAPITTHSRYDPGSDSWTTRAALPTARWGMASVHLGGKIYVMGGTTNGSAASSANDIFDIAGNSWSSGTALPASLTATYSQGQRACTDGTYIYVMSGSALERYDPAGNSWTSLASHPAAPGNWQSLICDGTYIYCIGGSNTNTNIRRYVIGTNTWDGTVYDTAPYGAWAMVCEPVSDGTYLIGFGRIGTSQEQSSQLWNWNPSTKVWTQQRSFDLPTNAAASAVIGGKLYVYGAWVIGKAETYSFGHHACFNISSGAWETTPAVVELWRSGVCVTGRILTAAPFAGNGRWYVGRQDGLTSLRSGAKVGELRLRGTCPSRAAMLATHATLTAASAFAAVGAASGAGWSVSITESASTADTQAAAYRINAAASIAESAAAAETLAAAALIVAALTESASAADAAASSYSATGSAAVGESASASDAVTAAAVVVASLLASASADDVLAAAATASVALVEAAAAVDQASSSYATAGAVGVTESASAADALGAAAVLLRAIAEDAGAADSLVAAATMVRAITETAVAVDAITVGAASNWAVTVEELAAAVDTIAAVAGLVRLSAPPQALRLNHATRAARLQQFVRGARTQGRMR